MALAWSIFALYLFWKHPHFLVKQDPAIIRIWSVSSHEGSFSGVGIVKLIDCLIDSTQLDFGLLTPVVWPFKLLVFNSLHENLHVSVNLIKMIMTPCHNKKIIIFRLQCILRVVFKFILNLFSMGSQNNNLSISQFQYHKFEVILYYKILYC